MFTEHQQHHEHSTMSGSDGKLIGYGVQSQNVLQNWVTDR